MESKQASKLEVSRVLFMCWVKDDDGQGVACVVEALDQEEARGVLMRDPDVGRLGLTGEEFSIERINPLEAGLWRGVLWKHVYVEDTEPAGST